MERLNYGRKKFSNVALRLEVTSTIASYDVQSVTAVNKLRSINPTPLYCHSLVEPCSNITLHYQDY